MSKINAVRLINLNYNNNSIRVSDEIFQMGGQSTLLSLRNGGGKSVLVQMMTAPFVHKQYRKTKDRPFESYFTTSKPTFIMVEWKLDDGAGYCLTGMMVRKNQAPEEQSAEPLEIINFISEYPNRCEQDIYHIPVVEKAKDEVILKNFNACRQLFELYKKDRSKKFYSYDMNNYAQSRQYFDKLAEYKIYYKEWETIIRKVNLKESGLSELFSDCKTEKDLVEKWFLETIQDKLNQDKNRVKEFQNIVDKYICMYKNNQSKIERRDTILKFKEDMSGVEEKAKIYLDAEQKVKAEENQIACFIQELSRLEEKSGKRQQELEGSQKECNADLSHILYEKLSMEIHQLGDDLRMHDSNKDMIRAEMDTLEEEIQNIEKMVHIYECAKQQEIVTEKTKEYELLEQKIDVSRKKEQELGPEREQIGGYLNHYYTRKLDALKKTQEENDLKREEAEHQQNTEAEKETACQKQIEQLIAQIATKKAEMEQFSKREEEFNQEYGEAFSRNILGDYEAGMLEIKQQQYKKQLEEAQHSRVSNMRLKDETEEKKKNCERNREDSLNAKKEKEYARKELQKEEQEYEEQLKKRQVIMRYLEAEEGLLWKTDALLELADRKLAEIDRNRSALEQEYAMLQRECRKLTSGEVLELPQEFKDLLDELGLHPVYGMNWLERNGYSEEENTKLVRRQPFLPYSLILSGAEIAKLEANGKDIYTSFPIPLIPRENLEKTLTEEENSILKLSGISFYIWFNEKLLDAEALRVLISQKEAEIKKKKEQLEQKKQEYAEYTERRSILKSQTLSKEAVDKNRAAQVEVQEAIQNLDEETGKLTEQIRQFAEQLHNLNEQIQHITKAIESYNRRERDFDKFCENYRIYQEDRREIERFNQEKKTFEEKKKQAVSMQQQYADVLKSLEHMRQELDRQEERYEEKLAIYTGYTFRTDYKPDLQPDELEARYEAITTKMSTELQELETRLQSASNEKIRENKELKRLQDKYHVLEREWKTVLYNAKEQTHLEINLEDKQKQAKKKDELWHEEDKQVAILKSRINDKKKGIAEQCGKEEPLPKTEIRTMDFDATMNELRYKRKELEKQIRIVEEHARSLGENLTAFAEYQDFAITDAVAWEEDFEHMSPKELKDFSGAMRRDYRVDTEEKNKRRGKLNEHLNMLIRKDIYQEDYYRKPLEAMLAVTEQAELVLAQLDTTIRSYNSQLEKLAVDIEMVEKEKAKIEELLEDYIREVHNNMAKIDNNSTITVRERPIKMLRIQMPDWEENAGIYHQRLEDFMEELTRNGIEIYERNENASDYLSTRITTKNLYDTVVGTGNVQIKLYKIEEKREYPITWAEVGRNSGGEGFLSAFVILTSLLHYMRRDDTDIFADRNEGKVLVMDNPFAQTNAAHLLKPLMDMAKKTNTQLICLSGLGGDSIYGRFDNIYVLNLVDASMRQGMQYLRGDHRKGSEEEIMISSQIEVMEQQSFLF